MIINNFFDVGLHHLGKSGRKINSLNIGAMDGVMFDEMIGYTQLYGFNVLYVEPIPYLFERLKTNLKNIGLFENSAISDYNGEIEMLTIKREVIDNGLVHNCFYGMSAVYPPKNGLGSEFDRPTVESYGELIKVPCITFETLLNKHNIQEIDVIKVDAEGHDFTIFKQINFEKFNPSIIRLEWINLSETDQNNIIETFNKHNYRYEISGQDIVGLSEKMYNELTNSVNQPINTNENDNKITIVTGLWDIGRDKLTNDWSRNFKHYLDKLDELLKIDCNLIIFGDEVLKNHVMSVRNQSNTQFILRNTDWFRNNEYFDKIQLIRTSPDWYNQVGWLKDSTQSQLEYYNPLVMSKVFLLNDAKIMDKFNSDYLFWLDAGITNTVHQGYFTHDKVINNLSKHIKNFLFLAFPYETTTEIHGFKFDEINKLAGNKVELVGRGGFFGGSKDDISKINSIYYSLLSETLNNNLMGTEESLFSIMMYKYPELISYYKLDSNGLISKFFEDLKNDNIVLNSTVQIISNNTSINLSNTNINVNITNTDNNVGLYVIGFNSPKQLETLITSMIQYDKDFIEKPRKILLDNSTDLSTTPIYSELCSKYGFEHIKKDNLGICGGRQWIAEHFDKSDLDYMYFFEDDMFFYPHKGEVCRNGFNRMVDNLYSKTLSISKKENFDFLKLNYSEFFGDNSTQWSWYNVPQMVRDEFWPEYPKLPEQGTDPNAPRVRYENVKSYDNLPYVTGEIYYCNWPQLVSKSGNRKMFLNTTWAHPYEQTWMSFMYQELKKGNLNFGLLLLTPTEHNRFDHYSRELRKES